MEASMKYTVNDSCIGCGLCAGTCPEVFSIGDDGKAHAVNGDVPANVEGTAAEALSSCPVQAIEENK
jgi:ferredoxin